MTPPHLRHIWRLYYGGDSGREPHWKCDCSPTLYPDGAARPDDECPVAAWFHANKNKARPLRTP